MAICSVDPVGCRATVDYLHMPGQAFFFFFVSNCFCSVYKYIHSWHICHPVWHHLAQIVAIYMLSYHHFHEMCVCAVSWHIDVINILLLSHYLYYSLPCENVAQFYGITWWQHVHTYSGLWFSAFRKFLPVTAFGYLA